MGGSRNTTMERLAAQLPSFGGLDHPVVDQTGPTGEFDFTLEWTPPEADPNTQPDTQETTFLQALREQLGLKLESAKAPLQTLIIDHVELRPSRIDHYVIRQCLQSHLAIDCVRSRGGIADADAAGEIAHESATECGWQHHANSLSRVPCLLRSAVRFPGEPPRRYGARRSFHDGRSQSAVHDAITDSGAAFFPARSLLPRQF